MISTFDQIVSQWKFAIKIWQCTIKISSFERLLAIKIKWAIKISFRTPDRNDWSKQNQDLTTYCQFPANDGTTHVGWMHLWSMLSYEFAKLSTKLLISYRCFILTSNENILQRWKMEKSTDAWSFPLKF